MIYNVIKHKDMMLNKIFGHTIVFPTPFRSIYSVSVVLPRTKDKYMRHDLSIFLLNP